MKAKLYLGGDRVSVMMWNRWTNLYYHKRRKWCEGYPFYKIGEE